jgi:hypothetical protein
MFTRSCNIMDEPLRTRLKTTDYAYSALNLALSYGGPIMRKVSTDQSSESPSPSVDEFRHWVMRKIFNLLNYDFDLN